VEQAEEAFGELVVAGRDCAIDPQMPEHALATLSSAIRVGAAMTRSDALA
jgi:hypothetical protein